MTHEATSAQAHSEATSTEVLADRLHVSDREARARAARALYARLLEEPGAAAPLAEVLRDGDDDARRRAAEVLAAVPEAAEPAWLLRVLGDRDPVVREHAARALARRRAASPRVLLGLIAAAADPQPRVRVTALGALVQLAPSTPVVAALGAALVSDRYSVADAALRTVGGADEAAVRAAAPLLAARDPLDKRAGLAVVHATGARVDAIAPAVARLAAPGNEAYVRRAAVRALGRMTAPDRAVVALLEQALSDWDPTLRVTACVSLGQLGGASRAARRAYDAGVLRTAEDEVPDLAAALRAAGPPPPPAEPLLHRVAAARGYARLDLADALLAPRRAHAPVPGALRDGVVLPVDEARVDDAVESMAPRARPRAARGFLALASHADPVVRACAVVFATQLHRDVETAIELQRLADQDAEPAVRAVARALLDELRQPPGER